MLDVEMHDSLTRGLRSGDLKRKAEPAARSPHLPLTEPRATSTHEAQTLGSHSTPRTRSSW